MTVERDQLTAIVFKMLAAIDMMRNAERDLLQLLTAQPLPSPPPPTGE